MSFLFAWKYFIAVLYWKVSTTLRGRHGEMFICQHVCVTAVIFDSCKNGKHTGKAERRRHFEILKNVY